MKYSFIFQIEKHQRSNNELILTSVSNIFIVHSSQYS